MMVSQNLSEMWYVHPSEAEHGASGKAWQTKHWALGSALLSI